MTDNSIGILAYGCYIPPTRLPLAAIRGGMVKDGGPQKAVANFDEDAITMAVTAGADCLHDIQRELVTGLYLATTSSPFREKQAAAFVAKALDLPQHTETIDFSGTLRAAGAALQAAINAVRSDPKRQILVLASDARLPAPRSPLEANSGDAAAAFLIGAGSPVATLQDRVVRADELYDVWRGEHDEYVRSWEDRFNVIHGYTANVQAVCEALLDTLSEEPGSFAGAVLYGPDARSHGGLARKLGFRPEQVQDPWFGKVGNCGAAFGPLMLVAALETAALGDRLLVALYGDGAEAMTCTVVSSQFRPKRTTDWYLQRGRALRSYDAYLDARHLSSKEHDPRGGDGVPATVHFRERDADISFQAQRCRRCGTVHFPACRVCYHCFAKDDFEPERLSDRQGRVLSYSFDYFFPSTEPPVIVGVCEVDNGARVYVQMADARMDQLRCDLPVEFVFRKIHDAGNKPNYFWKSRPLESVGEV